MQLPQEGRYKATWKREFKLPWREAGPPNHLDDKVDSDQKVAIKEVCFCAVAGGVCSGAVQRDGAVDQGHRLQCVSGPTSHFFCITLKPRVV